jgi:hypothetical protein
MRKITNTALALGALAGLGGCATPLLTPMVSAVPGPDKPIAVFQVDQFDCTNYADRKVAAPIEAVNNYEAASAAIDTGSGAGISGLGVGLATVTGHDRRATAEAVARSAPGATLYANAYGTDGALQRAYDIAYAQCMQAKGNDVPSLARLSAVGTP